MAVKDCVLVVVVILVVATATAYVADVSCSGRGTLQGDRCHCDDSYFGSRCECSGVEGQSSNNCSPTSVYTNVVCSGRGQCVCGVCLCHARPDPDEIITGHYCECDNYSCDRHNGLVCGGPERGQCLCGRCTCRPGYVGDDCSVDARNPY